MILAGQAYLNTANQMLSHGDNPMIPLDKSLSLADLVLERAPHNPHAIHLKGSALLSKSTWIYERGSDGKALLLQSIHAFERAANQASGDPVLMIELATALQTAANIEFINGGDGGEAFTKSNIILKQLIEQPDAPLFAWVQYADGLSWQAYYRFSRGRDAEDLIVRAINIAKQSVQKAPQNKHALKTLAMAEYTYAELHYVKDEDPTMISAEADSHYQQIIDQDPDNYLARINQLGPMSLAIDYALEHKHSQQLELSLMHQRILELEQHRDKRYHADLIWADYWRYVAKQTLLENKDPSKQLALTRKYLDTALKGKIDRYEAVQSFAYNTVFEHQWRQYMKQWDAALYKQDKAHLSEFIKEYPDLPLLRALRGQLTLLTPSSQAQHSGINDLKAALEANPLLRSRFRNVLAQAMAIP